MHEQADAAALPLSQHLPAGCSRGLWWRTLLVLLWETGCRRGELLSLRWSEVDLEGRALAVNPANVKSKRLKISSFGDLGEQHLRRLAQFGADASGLVFAWRHDPTRLNEQLGLIQAAAGIDSTRAGLKFHAFRRTVGDTIAELHGLTAAQQKLGHSTASITAKHYAAAAMRRLAKKTAMPVPDSLRAASEAVIEAPLRRGHSEVSAESS
jgi:integrase